MVAAIRRQSASESRYLSDILLTKRLYAFLGVFKEQKRALASYMGYSKVIPYRMPKASHTRCNILYEMLL
jgi:hypothetical protein